MRQSDLRVPCRLTPPTSIDTSVTPTNTKTVQFWRKKEIKTERKKKKPNKGCSYKIYIVYSALLINPFDVIPTVGSLHCIIYINPSPGNQISEPMRQILQCLPWVKIWLMHTGRYFNMSYLRWETVQLRKTLVSTSHAYLVIHSSTKLPSISFSCQVTVQPHTVM